LSLRSGLSFILKIVVLTLLLFVIMSVASLAVGFGDTGQADAAAAGQALLIVCLLYSIVLSYPIIRSRWYGLPLVLTVVVVFYGIMTFLSQIETVVFLKHLVDIVPAEVIPKLFLQGAIVAILFSPLAVLVHGKMKEKGYFLPEHNTRLQMPVVQWIWKLALLAVIYILIYIGIGMYWDEFSKGNFDVCVDFSRVYWGGSSVLIHDYFYSKCGLPGVWYHGLSAEIDKMIEEAMELEAAKKYKEAEEKYIIAQQAGVDEYMVSYPICYEKNIIVHRSELSNLSPHPLMPFYNGATTRTLVQLKWK
jgi:hypothetical protein